MKHFFSWPAAGRRGLVLLVLWLIAGAGRAQAPTWGPVAAALVAQSDIAEISGVATDASGNVFVVGNFRGTLTLGSITLTSAGIQDWFVAKYVPGTSTWAWAQRGGGTSFDTGRGIAVSGTSVYVTGDVLVNGNLNAVTFGGTGAAPGPLAVVGTSSNLSLDLVLLKLTDNGTSATATWVQAGGGAYQDAGYGVVASGNTVYVAGVVSNTQADFAQVLFGGNGTTPGTRTVRGASSSANPDVLLAKYTDNGTAGSFVWAQVGGGTESDYGTGLALRGNNLYVISSVTNDRNNGTAVLFGGDGTTPGTVTVRGASATSSADVVLAKYTDNGTTGSYTWAQVGGGTSGDQGYGVAVGGSSVYVTGYLVNNQANGNGVLFGSNGTAAGTATVRGATTTASGDVLLAKYTDNGATGSFVWAQVGGGTDGDYGTSVAVSGNGILVTGVLINSAGNSRGVLFGGDGTTAGTATVRGLSTSTTYDLLLTRYTDNGSTGSYNWGLAAGGDGLDQGLGVAVSGQQVLVGGGARTVASFGATQLTTPTSTNLGVLARLTDAALPLPTRAAVSSAPQLAPNPVGAGEAATVGGIAPGEAVQVLDALGRVAATATADATGVARLAGLTPGLYLVRAGSATVRLQVK